MEENCTGSMSLEQLSGKKKKRLFVKINAQMEFYFSDSNLAKDKFLQNLIEQSPDGYVDLEVFKSFNKLKELTEDINIISAAISKSNILEVNGRKVRRVTPIGKTKDFDACTLYVEKLPSHTDHKWIKDVFENFGTVDYINIPRFKISKKSKGFAFVEFSSPDGVRKACEHYKKTVTKQIAENEEKNVSVKKGKARKSSQLCDSNEKNSKRRKVDTGPDLLTEKNCEDLENKPVSKDSAEESGTEKDMLSQRKNKKRKLESNESDIPSKKLKDSEFETSDDDKAQSAENDKIENQIADGAVSDSADGTSGKSKRKRKKKKKSDHAERPSLRVMSKYEWKAYRNRYLALQRSTMSHIKHHIMLQTQELREMELSSKSEVVSESPKKGLQFQSGVILKVTLSDPIENSTEIKDKVKATANVAYIDAPLGHSELFVRCHNSEEAHSIIKDSKLCKVGSVELLQGTEEEAYWKKIEDDRKTKFSVPLSNKKRGRDKIIAKAAKLAEQKNKHIYFDE